MPTIRHDNFLLPLPANVRPSDLLGRLTLDPRLTVTNLNGQLSPAPNSVSIQASVQAAGYQMGAGIQGQRHVFAPGPARIWNAMLANARSVTAISNIFANNQQAWLIIEVFTVGGAVTALTCCGPNFLAVLFPVPNAQTSAGAQFLSQPVPWYKRIPPPSPRTLQIVGIGVGTAVAAPLVIGGVLGALGFSAGGVVAGSIAAGWQAGIGNVAAGSLFAGLQSLGAVGLNAGVAVALGGGAAAGTAAGTNPAAGITTNTNAVNMSIHILDL